MDRVSRREFFGISSVAVGSTLLLNQFNVSLAAVTSTNKDVTPEQWMSAWMSYRSVSGALKLSRFKDPIYFLLEPISWVNTPSKPGLPQQVIAPKGFVTDLASIPRIFWSLLRPDGDYAYAAIIHDYLYWEQHLARDQSDEILRAAMEDFHIQTPTVFAIYEAVRTGGAAAWSGNAREREHGEKRILKRFPEDPRITWAEWKKQPDVFE
jgi:hypothetical protein